jgi:hypothetical protein
VICGHAQQSLGIKREWFERAGKHQCHRAGSIARSATGQSAASRPDKSSLAAVCGARRAGATGRLLWCGVATALPFTSGSMQTGPGMMPFRATVPARMLSGSGATVISQSFRRDGPQPSCP